MIGRLVILLVRAYQVVLSPLVGNCCRFQPSCSNYMIDAIRKHGCLKGLWLGACRLAKCHPLHPGGIDPVPDAKMVALKSREAEHYPVPESAGVIK